MTIKELVEIGILRMEEKICLFDGDALLLSEGLCRQPQIVKYKDCEIDDLVWIKERNGEKGYWRIVLKYTRKQRIIVAGSCNFTDYPVVEKVLQDYLKTYPWEVEMISGTAKGRTCLESGLLLPMDIRLFVFLQIGIVMVKALVLSGIKRWQNTPQKNMAFSLLFGMAQAVEPKV